MSICAAAAAGLILGLGACASAGDAETATRLVNPQAVVTPFATDSPTVNQSTTAAAPTPSAIAVPAVVVTTTTASTAPPVATTKPPVAATTIKAAPVATKKPPVVVKTTKPVPPPTSKATTPPAAGCAYHATIANGTAVCGASQPHPAGAMAECHDGTISFSASFSGTCSHHSGVAVWYQ